jgi:DNA-binding response OmpR family regulator
LHDPPYKLSQAARTFEKEWFLEMQSRVSALIDAEEILVVATCPVLVKGLSRILLNAGYSIDVVSEASRPLTGLALAILVSSEPYWRIEHIYKVCSAIRYRAPELPIMVFGPNDVDTKVQLFANGADDYIFEPFDAKEFLARVRGHIRRRKNH